MTKEQKTCPWIIRGAFKLAPVLVYNIVAEERGQLAFVPHTKCIRALLFEITRLILAVSHHWPI